MIGSFANIFRIPALRRKVLITLVLLCGVFRIGAHVPIPFIDTEAMVESFNSAGSGGVFDVVDMFSGGAFKRMTIFALGIMPYISASIILQLLTVVWPRLEKIAKEGEAGRKKINQWTRYGTVILGLFQGAGIGGWVNRSGLSLLSDHPLLFIFTTAMTISAGTCFLMWLGEKISEHGIGNGISLVIAAGIVAAYPTYLMNGFRDAAGGLMTGRWLGFVGVLISMALVSALIVLMQEANRKIPVQHARRMVGRKVMQGGSTFIPLKLNTAGVIPVIFSSAILSFPQMLIGQFSDTSWGGRLSNMLTQNGTFNLYDMLELRQGMALNLLKMVNPYALAYIVLTAFFCYFYTAVTFNPVDLADNLKKSGAFIPGRKPGKPTSDFINHILVRITAVGALFLISVAMVPDVLFVSFDMPYGFASIAGGTGLIIIVGVVLDTMKQIESQLLMRHYEGFRYRTGGGAAARRARR